MVLFSYAILIFSKRGLSVGLLASLCPRPATGGSPARVIGWVFSKSLPATSHRRFAGATWLRQLAAGWGFFSYSMGAMSSWGAVSALPNPYGQRDRALHHKPEGKTVRYSCAGTAPNMASFSVRGRMTRQGTPAATTPAGMSLVTTEPAPITAS